VVVEWDSCKMERSHRFYVFVEASKDIHPFFGHPPTPSCALSVVAFVHSSSMIISAHGLPQPTVHVEGEFLA
jgi:hypothetical protein